ncbi:hypothetical protein AAMO2058_001744300, partial [Amorphochlora amoebiformis]
MTLHRTYGTQKPVFRNGTTPGQVVYGTQVMDSEKDSPRTLGFVVFGLVTNTAKGNRMNVADQGGRPTLFIDCDDTLYSVSESGLILRITLS